MLIAIAIAEEIQGLGGSESFELLNFLGLWQEVSQISEKLHSKVKENLQNFYEILCNPWIGDGNEHLSDTLCSCLLASKASEASWGLSYFKPGVLSGYCCVCESGYCN